MGKRKVSRTEASRDDVVLFGAFANRQLVAQAELPRAVIAAQRAIFRRPLLQRIVGFVGRIAAAEEILGVA